MRKYTMTTGDGTFNMTWDELERAEDRCEGDLMILHLMGVGDVFTTSPGTCGDVTFERIL